MEQFQLFEKYLEGKLNKQEKTSFESRLKIEPALEADFARHVKTQKIFDLLIQEEVKAEISLLENNNSGIKFIRPILGIAATLLILVSSFFILRHQNSPQQLFDKNFELVQLERLRSNENQVIDPALDLLQKAQSTIHYDIDKGINYLNAIIVSGNSDYVELAQWNLALFYLFKEDIKSCRSSLKPILSNKEHSLYKRAQKLESKLNKWSFLF